MAARKPGTNEILGWLGLSGLSTDLALYCFEIALRYKPTQLMIGRFHWEKMKEKFEGLYKRFEDFGEDFEEENEEENKILFKKFEEYKRDSQKFKNLKNPKIPNFEEIITSAIREQLKIVNSDNNEDRILEFVQNSNFNSLGFMEMGLDSLRLYQLTSDLNERLERFGLKINIIDLFERGNVEKLGEYLNKRLEENEGRRVEEKSVRPILIENKRKNVELKLEDENKILEEILVFSKNHLFFGEPLVPAALQIQQFIECLKSSNLDIGKTSLLIEEIKFNRKMFLNEWENVKINCKNTKINEKEENKFNKIFMELGRKKDEGEEEGSQSFSSCQINLEKYINER